jgi:hypothetical protein
MYAVGCLANYYQQFGIGHTVGEGIVSNVVPWAVEEDEENNSNTSGLVLATSSKSSHSIRHGNSPCNIDALNNFVSNGSDLRRSLGKWTGH